MRFKFIIILILFTLACIGSLNAAKVEQSQGTKKLDLLKWHDVGNIWMRVSNYGFFGSGDDVTPRYPSLEYPGGSGADYLYQGALWFGAKKVRRNTVGQILYWQRNPNSPGTVESDVDTADTYGYGRVVDTLVSSGFDGDDDTYELLPAYNPLETNHESYQMFNGRDTIMNATIRTQRRGVDDDLDGNIDEDPVGYSFPLRKSDDLPDAFQILGEADGYRYLHDLDATDMSVITANIDIWYPLGFVYLGDRSNVNYNFSEVKDDDLDVFYDEDGYPVSEQDYISYYYDYSPLGTAGDRDWGTARSSNDHYPLNIRVRQLSYQWSYEYIKNLCYVEFNITNMNLTDTLFDCAMGVYMDSDVGPNTWGNEKAGDDLSSYVQGEGYEFAYTYDLDGDGGLCNGFVGSRVCTPDPEELEFACWTWDVGQGPDDTDPYDLTPSGKTSNQKYWLLTGRNPDDSKYISLRDEPNEQAENEADGCDTRYLFAFYGDMQGMTAPSDSSWNLEPGETMKIVLAVFPGDTVEELKGTALWAKQIYKNPQRLVDVVKPDIYAHYMPPEPPGIPRMVSVLDESGSNVHVYWENSPEYAYDLITVSEEQLGWQDEPQYSERDSYYSNSNSSFPSEFAYVEGVTVHNPNALVNPWTAYRLRHDFQGYTLWIRSGSGSQEDWSPVNRWDKVETQTDYVDYQSAWNQSCGFVNLGGEEGENRGLPDPRLATGEDLNYYHYNELYELVPYAESETTYGNFIYDYSVEYSPELVIVAASYDLEGQKLLFKHPDMPADLYLQLCDDKLIPLPDHEGYNRIVTDGDVDAEKILELKKDRLSRRYYHAIANNVPKGIELYIALTSWDRGMPEKDLEPLESGRDKDANMKILFPGPSATDDMNNIFVVPNPYLGLSKFDGRRENDEKGDKSRRIWFCNIPENAKIRIYTLAGDLVDVIDHNGEAPEDIITVSRAAQQGIKASGMASWNLLSKFNQIVVSGVYLYSVENKDNGDIKVGKFAIIR